MNYSAAALEASRWSPISPTDHSGLLWIFSLLCGIFVVLSLLVRIYINQGYFRLDDFICSLATVRTLISDMRQADLSVSWLQQGHLEGYTADYPWDWERPNGESLIRNGWVPVGYI
jgi:hypothetical protein